MVKFHSAADRGGVRKPPPSCLLGKVPVRVTDVSLLIGTKRGWWYHVRI